MLTLKFYETVVLHTQFELLSTNSILNSRINSETKSDVLCKRVDIIMSRCNVSSELIYNNPKVKSQNILSFDNQTYN